MAVDRVTLVALEWGLFVPLATVSVLIRFVALYRYPSKFTWRSNWSVALSFGLFLVLPCLDTVAWRSGFFSSQATLDAPVTKDTTVYGLKVAYSHWVIYYITFWAITGIILSLYYQLISTSHKVYRMALNALSVVAFMAFLASVLLSLVWCRPIGLNWSLNSDEACFAPFDPTAVVVTGVMQVAIHVAIVLFPFPLLYGLSASTGEKASLATLLGLGILGVAATVFRLILRFATESLETYTLLARTELTLAMIVACSPAIFLFAARPTKTTSEMTPSGIFTRGALDGGFSRPASGGFHATTAATAVLQSQRRSQLDDHQQLLPPLNLTKFHLPRHHPQHSAGQNSINQHLLHADSPQISQTSLNSPYTPYTPSTLASSSLLPSAFASSSVLPSPGSTAHTTGTSTFTPSPLPSPAAVIPPIHPSPRARSLSSTTTLLPPPITSSDPPPPPSPAPLFHLPRRAPAPPKQHQQHPHQEQKQQHQEQQHQEQQHQEQQHHHTHLAPPPQRESDMSTPQRQSDMLTPPPPPPSIISFGPPTPSLDDAAPASIEDMYFGSAGISEADLVAVDGFYRFLMSDDDEEEEDEQEELRQGYMGRVDGYGADGGREGEGGWI